MVDRSGAFGRVDGGGLVVALVGFLLSRFAVLGTASSGTMAPAFLVGDGLSLALGLGLSVAGVALAVSSHSTAYVNTVAVWCLLGVAGMGLLVGSVLLESRMGGPSLTMAEGVPARILVGGAIGGAAIGATSARSARTRRDLQRYADRLTVLNRILRHEVLNKVNVIEGYAGLDGADSDEVIERNAVEIDRAIEEVGFLTQGDHEGATVALRPAVETAVAETRESFPAADLTVGDVPDVRLRAGDRLPTLLSNLLANAAEYGDAGRLSATVDDHRVAITVADDGPGLPADAEALLTDRDLPEYDDPTVGFGLTVVRLLVEEFDGEVTVATGAETAAGEGTEITVTLDRADDDSPTPDRVEIDPNHLLAVGVGGLVAGVVMGVMMDAFAGVVTVIGALYGAPSPIVGWLTHLFHSAVFAVAFVALLRGSDSLGSWGPDRRAVVIGTGFGVALWLVAAGLVMPVWLRAAGMAAPLPNLTGVGLIGHLLWGLVIGGWVGVLDRYQRGRSPAYRS